MKLSRIILVVALSLTTCAVFAQKPTSPVKRLPEIREIVEKKPAKRPKALMKQEKELVGNFCRIPGVTVTTDTSKEVTPSYYMLECEVMNKSYGRFLEDLKAQGRTADYEVAKIHNESGEPFFYSFDEQTGTSYNKKYTQSSDYGLLPVVNVSYEGAQLFCQWLTEKLGNGEWEYRLPTEWEWKWAAHDGSMFHTYALTGPYITNGNGKAPYNYRKVGDECITRTDSGFQVLTFDESVILHY
ncbi:MAG: formylglycine-generating enzyme family protein, partial [Bacteroidales bacterium]|nr:formylglycine-generating enzyme family protein [Bacteroidales bacterium]